MSPYLKTNIELAATAKEVDLILNDKSIDLLEIHLLSIEKLNTYRIQDHLKYLKTIKDINNETSNNNSEKFITHGVFAITIINNNLIGLDRLSAKTTRKEILSFVGTARKNYLKARNVISDDISNPIKDRPFNEQVGHLKYIELNGVRSAFPSLQKSFKTLDNIKKSH